MSDWQSLLRSSRFLHFLAALTFCLLYFGSMHFNPALSTRNDLYFGADCLRLLENLKNSDLLWTHGRDRLHPFFSLVAVSTARIPAAFGIAGAEFPFYRMVFGTLGAMLFFALLYDETSPLQSFGSLALLFSTLSLRLFSTLPESFLFGFFTIMLALYLVRIGAHPVAVLIASMASATTNIAIGIIHAVRSVNSLRHAVRIALVFLTVAAMLSVVQVSIYPSSDYWFNVLALRDETRYLSRTWSALPFRAFDFLFSGFAIPLQHSLLPPIDSRQEWGMYLLHGFWSKRATLAVALSLASIAALYLSSAVAFARNRKRTSQQTLLCWFIVFQFLFYMFYGESPYGESPFLYSLHFIPAIILFFSLNRLKKFEAVYPLAFLGLAVLLQYINLYNFDSLFG